MTDVIDDFKDEFLAGEEGKVTNDHVFKILSINTFVGCIIGKGSETIKMIGAETGCSVSAAKKDDMFPSTNCRVVYVSAENRQNLMAGVSKIINLQMDKVRAGDLKSDCENENHIKFNFTLPKPACGNVIGRNGDNIKNLRQSAGCSIQIHRDVHNYGPVPESIAEVIGETHQIEAVVHEILMSLEGEFENAWYPLWRDHKDSRSGGGKNQNQGQNQGGNNNRNQKNNNRQNNQVKRERPQDNMNQGNDRQQKRNKLDNPMQLIENIGAKIYDQKHISMTVDVSTRVPNEYAGCLIGKNGATIRGMSATSGCQMKLHEPEQNVDTRELDLRGGPLEVATGLLMTWSKLMEKAQADANTQKVNQQDEQAKMEKERLLRKQMEDLQKQLAQVRQG